MKIVTLATVVLCAAAFAQDAGVPAAPAAEPAADPVAQLDLLWKTRDEPAAIKATDAAISAGLKANPDDYQVLWRAARFRWWQADGTVEGQEKLKKQLGKEAWNLAERALKVKSDGKEAHYYVALGVGAYSQAVGVLTALSEGLEGKFVENLDYAIKADETFDTGGPRRAKGRYHWELPWPKRDLAKSKSELEAAIKLSPQQLRNYYYLADTYLKDGNAKEAKVQITKVLTGNGDWDPPEARRVKAWAKTLSAKIDEELK